MGTTVLLGSSIWKQRRSDKKKVEMGREKMEKEFTEACEKNTDQMSDKWSSMHLSREAVLNKTYKRNLSFILRKLLPWVKKSEADETTRAPKCVDDVIHFFLRWKNRHDDDTIDSARLKKYIKSEFRAFRDTLKEIRDEEASDWDEDDSNILNEVIDFLDEISKVETKGSGES